MARVLSTCLALLLWFGGTAWAAKPKIAVLGLEVVPGPTGAVDPAMTQLAKDITRDLRQRAQSEASRYTLAPNSSKELTDEKLLTSCDDEAVSCMAGIGAGLAADVMLYGRLERRGDVYRVSMKLLDVKARTVETTAEDMPVGAAFASVTRKLYTKLIGDTPAITSGSLVVKARSASGAVSGGAVIVDAQRRGELVAGSFTVTELPAGRHTVAIEAAGRYQRFEDSVTVPAGGQMVVDALLVEDAAPPQQRSVLWKVSLATGVLVAAGGGAYAWYAWDSQQRWVQQVNAMIKSDECGKNADTLLSEHSGINVAAFERSCTWHSRIYLGYAIGAVGAVGAVVSLIMMSRDPGPSEHRAGTRSRTSGIAIAPIWTPETAGASLSLHW
jgi:hypothetical protein